jgi:molybdopterin-guanine dinucleotide biosynthesis protein A
MSAPAGTRVGSPPAIGIFVGGRGVRMGGSAKANLMFEGRTILERTLDACAAATRQLFGSRATPRIWLVGDSSAYAAAHGVQRVEDDPRGVGPMGGLRAFLHELSGETPGLVIAGDLPFLTEHLIARLASEALGAAALAPRELDGRWQPLFARYEPRRTVPEIEAALGAGKTSLQHLFARLGQAAVALELSTTERGCLQDWDRPSDVTAGCPNSAK